MRRCLLFFKSFEYGNKHTTNHFQHLEREREGGEGERRGEGGCEKLGGGEEEGSIHELGCYCSQ